MITPEDVARTLARSAIAGPVPPELAVAGLMADAQADPAMAPYLLGVALAVARGLVRAGYDKAGKYVLEVTAAGRAAAEAPAVPLQTPDVLFAGTLYAHRHRAELAAHIRAGGVVAVLNLRSRKVAEWRSQERPACLAGMPDDTDLTFEAQYRLDCEAQRRRHGPPSFEALIQRGYRERKRRQEKAT